MIEFPLKHFLLICSCFTLSLSQTETLYYTPALPAPGEDVTLFCSFTSHPNNSFVSPLPTFYVDSVTVGATAIHDSYTVNGVDLSRYSVSISPDSTLREISANVTLRGISMADEDTFIGCSVHTSLFTSLTIFVPVNVSEPPYRINTLSRTPLHPLSCLTRLTWDQPYSDRNISSYTVYRDQLQIYANAPSDLFYDVVDPHQVGETWSYSVAPASVAGSSEGLSNIATVHVPEFAFEKGTFRVENGSENYLSWTTTLPFPEPVTVAYVLELLEAGIVRQTFSFTSNTDDNRYSFSSLNGDNYVLRLSAYRMCSQKIESSIHFNEEDPVTEAPVISDTIWIITGTGVLIVALWIIGVVVLVCLCCLPRKKFYKG